MPAAPSPIPDPRVERLTRILAGLSADLWLVGSVAMVLFTFRIILFGCLHRHFATDTSATTIGLGLLQGLRFDVQMAVVTALPSVAVSLLISSWQPVPRLRRTLRQILWTVITWCSLLLLVVDGFYFREFGHQFDTRLFEPLHEDLHALGATIWATYPVLKVLLGAAIFAAGLAWASRWVIRDDARWLPWWSTRSHPSRILGMILIIGFLVVGARGSLAHRPLQSGTAAVTSDRTLNLLIPSPWHALRVAILDHLQAAQAEAAGERAFARVHLPAAANLVFGPAGDGHDLDQAARQIAAPHLGPTPRHIVLVLLEGESGWVLMDQHRHLGLAPELTALAGRGLIVPRFVSAGSGTMYSVGPLFTGIPDCGVMQSLTPATQKPFPTSLAPIFTRLGYRTRFFYGGFLATKRYGAFASDQGFSEVFGQNDATETRPRNAWGVDDADLYALVRKTLDDHEPTCSVILTTSNHSPYEVDLAAAGFPDARLAAASGIRDPETLRVLGHLWYNDHCLGEFVRTLENKLPGLLVAVTGDHYGRRFLDERPDSAERSAVPCILYGPQILAGRTVAPGQVGTHLDLVRTLIELAAPAGTPYASWGHDLLGPLTTWTTGAGMVVTSTTWIDVADGASAAGVSVEDFTAARARDQATRALAWWRLFRGPALPR
jgi:phosphoglycerol transferase MdoB-like AlkP superfamily enzyme